MTDAIIHDALRALFEDHGAEYAVKAWPKYRKMQGCETYDVTWHPKMRIFTVRWTEPDTSTCWWRSLPIRTADDFIREVKQAPRSISAGWVESTSIDSRIFPMEDFHGHDIQLPC